MDNSWTKVRSAEVFKDRQITVYQEDWLSNYAGVPMPYTRVKIPDAVICVPVTTDGKFVLVRQFRQVLNEYSLEIPAGKLESGETPEAGVLRELAEETGYQAVSTIKIGVLHPSPGRLDCRVTAFLARVRKSEDGQSLDEDEDITIQLASRSEVLDLIRSGAIKAGTHIASLLMAIQFHPAETALDRP